MAQKTIQMTRLCLLFLLLTTSSVWAQHIIRTNKSEMQTSTEAAPLIVEGKFISKDHTYINERFGEFAVREVFSFEVSKAIKGTVLSGKLNVSFNHRGDYKDPKTGKIYKTPDVSHPGLGSPGNTELGRATYILFLYNIRENNSQQEDSILGNAPIYIARDAVIFDSSLSDGRMYSTFETNNTKTLASIYDSLQQYSNQKIVDYDTATTARNKRI